jgi:hypothetical protein
VTENNSLHPDGGRRAISDEEMPSVATANHTAKFEYQSISTLQVPFDLGSRGGAGVGIVGTVVGGPPVLLEDTTAGTRRGRRFRSLSIDYYCLTRELSIGLSRFTIDPQRSD